MGFKMYTHGGDIYNNCIEHDFSVNLNPLGTPENVMKAMRDALNLVGNYPDSACTKLKMAIAWYENVDSNHIICANGAAELIFSLVRVLGPKKALLMRPTFLEYEKALRQICCEIRSMEWECKRDYAYDEQWLSKYLAYLDEGYDMVFLTTPNNPTGAVLSQPMMRCILDKLTGTHTFVVLDESFVEFIDEETMSTLTAEFSNFFVLKSFTKTFSIPGVRLGYGICSDCKLLNDIEASGQSWPVSVIAQEAGVAALQDEKLMSFLTSTKECVRIERQFLVNALEICGLKVVHGEGNFILFYCTDTTDLYSELLRRKILIRKCDNFAGLSPQHYRIAVKKREDNIVLIQALKEIFNV